MSEELKLKLYPTLGGPPVDELTARKAYYLYALRFGNSQSFETIHRRGGIAWDETAANLKWAHAQGYTRDQLHKRFAEIDERYVRAPVLREETMERLRNVCHDLDDPDKFGTPGAFEHIAIHLLRDIYEELKP